MLLLTLLAWLARMRGGRPRRWSVPPSVRSQRSSGCSAAWSGWCTPRLSPTRSCSALPPSSGCRRPCSACWSSDAVRTTSVGALLGAVGAVPCLILGREAYSAAAARSPGLPDSMLLVALEQGGWMWWYVPVALLVLFFPDGRLPGPRWRWVVAGLLAVALAFGAAERAGARSRSRRRTKRPRTRWAPGLPQPFRRSTMIAFALLPTLLGLLIAAGWSAVVRSRRADAVQRAQLRWLALGGLLVPATLLLCWTSYLLLGGADLVLIGIAGLVGIPAAIAIAMLRHDLYDVDRRSPPPSPTAWSRRAARHLTAARRLRRGLLLGRDSTAAAAAATALRRWRSRPLRRRLQRRRRPPALPAAPGGPRRDRRAAARRPRRRRRGPSSSRACCAAALRDPACASATSSPGGAGLVDATGAAVEPARRAVPVRWRRREIGALCGGSVAAGAAARGRPRRPRRWSRSCGCGSR